MEEIFEKTYNKIVDEYSDIMEKLREEAKIENRYNMLILAIIVVINIALNLLCYKLTNTFSFEIMSAFITISTVIFTVIKHRGGKSKIEKYASEFKIKIIGMMVKSFNKDFEFTPTERINFRSI